MATPTPQTPKKLALSIIDFLQTSLRNNTLQPEDADSVEIASNCIAECFHVDPSDTAAMKDAVGSQSLLQIYAVYEKMKGASSASTPAAAAATGGEKKGVPTPESEKLKGQGNAAMQKKDYATAITSYTAALGLSPSNPIYLSNRAAAYSANSQHAFASADAELAVATDPTYTKAWSRLGLARYALGDARGSMEAYESGIKAEGNGGSDAMKKGFETARKCVEAEGPEVEEPDSDDDGDEEAARGAPAAGAGGMPDLSALAGMMGGGGGGGGMPDLSALAGMMGGGGGAGGAGGMPDIGALMQNPMVQQMMQNPQMRQMASSMMSNPAMLQNLMGGAGRGGAGAGAAAGGGGGMPDIAAMMKDPAIAEM